jgi:hypothetical protein
MIIISAIRTTMAIAANIIVRLSLAEAVAVEAAGEGVEELTGVGLTVPVLSGVADSLVVGAGAGADDATSGVALSGDDSG